MRRARRFSKEIRSEAAMSAALPKHLKEKRLSEEAMEASLVVEMVLQITSELALQMAEPSLNLPIEIGQIGWKKLSAFELS